AQRALLGWTKARVAIMLARARLYRPLIEVLLARPGRAQAGEVFVARNAGKADADDLLQLVVYCALGVRKQHCFEQRLRVRGHAREDTRKQRVRYAELLAMRDKLAQFGIADFCGCERSDVRHH